MPPSQRGSDCDACLTVNQPDTQVTCTGTHFPTGAWSVCPASCGFPCGV